MILNLRYILLMALVTNTLLTLTLSMFTVMATMISMVMTMVVIMAMINPMVAMSMAMVMSMMVSISSVFLYRWGNRLCICFLFALLRDLSALKRNGNRDISVCELIFDIKMLPTQMCFLAVICGLYLMCALATDAFAVGIFDGTLHVALSNDAVWK